jgi:biuret amidohydrolase
VSWREDLKGLPNFAPSEFELDAAKTALIIVDMQYLGADRRYGFGQGLKQSHPKVIDYFFTRVEQLVIPNTKRILAAFRERSMRVIYLTLGPELPDGADMLPLRRPKTAPGLKSIMYYKGTFEHRIIEDLAPIEGELVVNKTSRSAFNSTGIERLLLNLGIDGLVVTGVSTSACVEMTARDAADRGFKVAIVEDATAEFDETSHESSLLQFSMRWGRVWTANETIAILDKLQEGKKVPVGERV